MKFGSHFNIWEWVDYVRNTGNATRFSPMNDHLAAGCRRCERLVRVLGEFARRAPLESLNEPSPQIVRLAEAFLFNDATAAMRGEVDRLREIEAALLGVR